MKRYNNILSCNFAKLKRVVVIFAKQHERSKETLTVQRKSTSTIISAATFPCKMKRSPTRYMTTPKRNKISQNKQKSV